MRQRWRSHDLKILEILLCWSILDYLDRTLQLWLQFKLICFAKIYFAIAWLFVYLFFANDQLLFEVLKQLLSDFIFFIKDQILDLNYGLTEEIFTDDHRFEQKGCHGVQMSIACQKLHAENIKWMRSATWSKSLTEVNKLKVFVKCAIHRLLWH